MRVLFPQISIKVNHELQIVKPIVNFNCVDALNKYANWREKYGAKREERNVKIKEESLTHNTFLQMTFFSLNRLLLQD